MNEIIFGVFAVVAGCAIAWVSDERLGEQ